MDPNPFHDRRRHRLGVFKYYLKVSDETLLESINSYWTQQMFRRIKLGENWQINDCGIRSRWPVFLCNHLKEGDIRLILAKEWSEHIEEQQSNLSDATCHETNVRYPVDVKLIWEVIQWLHKQMCALCIHSKSRHPRNKFRDIKKWRSSTRTAYEKTYKMRLRITRGLLYLSDKMLDKSKF